MQHAVQAQGAAGKKAQQACAECLGALGAVDPARITLDLAPPPRMVTSQQDLLLTLLGHHLVRVLRVASSLQVLDAASVAIQVSTANRLPPSLALHIPLLLGHTSPAHLIIEHLAICGLFVLETIDLCRSSSAIMAMGTTAALLKATLFSWHCPWTHR